MNANEAKHQAQLAEWRERVASCRSSGLSVRAWCEEQDIGYKRYYRWEREVLRLAGQQLVQADANRSLPAPVFAELPIERREASVEKIIARVQIGTGKLEVYAGAGAEVVAVLCRALKDAE